MRFIFGVLNRWKRETVEREKRRRNQRQRNQDVIDILQSFQTKWNCVLYLSEMDLLHKSGAREL